MTGVIAAIAGSTVPAGGATITLSNFTVQDLTGPAYVAGFNVNNTGTITARAGTTGSIGLPQNWTDDGGATASLYDVRATTLTGDPLDTNDGVWLNLATTRQYFVSSGQGTYTVEIRLSSSGVVQASCVATLDSVP